MRFAHAKPFLMPVVAFAAAIGLGSILLLMPIFRNGAVSPVDAIFIATSAVSVTGLAPFDAF